MNTNRLSKKIEDLLNRQITFEAYAAQAYLALGAWADAAGYVGIPKYLFRHSLEEREHMMQVVDYIMSRGGNIRVEAIDKPAKNPVNLQNCFEIVYELEVLNSEAVYDIVNQAKEEKDWSTWSFAQDFVKEQIEEEAMARDLIDKLKIAGGDKASPDALYSLDRDLGAL